MAGSTDSQAPSPSVEVIMVHHERHRAVYDHFVSVRTGGLSSSKNGTGNLTPRRPDSGLVLCPIQI